MGGFFSPRFVEYGVSFFLGHHSLLLGILITGRRCVGALSFTYSCNTNFPIFSPCPHLLRHSRSEGVRLSLQLQEFGSSVFLLTPRNRVAYYGRLRKSTFLSLHQTVWKVTFRPLCCVVSLHRSVSPPSPPVYSSSLSPTHRSWRIRSRLHEPLPFFFLLSLSLLAQFFFLPLRVPGFRVAAAVSLASALAIALNFPRGPLNFRVFFSSFPLSFPSCFCFFPFSPSLHPRLQSSVSQPE